MTTTVRPAPLQTQDEELHGPVRERNAWFLINLALSFVGVVAVGYAKTKDRPSPSLKRGHRAPADVVRRGRWSS